MAKAIASFPVRLAKPAQRALESAGIKGLKDFSLITEEEFSNLHGIGPNAIQKIKVALSENGLTFKKS